MSDSNPSTGPQAVPEASPKAEPGRKRASAGHRGTVTARGTPGVVAAGHPATAAAGCAALEAGGNAFDAVLASLMACCVAEPMLASLAGGGFLLARTAEGDVTLYDFFAQTPLERRQEDLDFYPIEGDFGETVQEFHIGLGSIACPGAVKALFEVQRDLARLPLTELIQPAVGLARDGLALNWMQANTFQVLQPIAEATEGSRRLFCRGGRAGELLEEGEIFSNPDFADFLEALAREGEGWFYEGEPARHLAEACRQGGGLLSLEDLARYRLERREPLRLTHGGARLATNPGPSSGGTLIAFGLELLRHRLAGLAADGPEHLLALVEALATTSRARREIPKGEHGELDLLLDSEHLDRYRRLAREHPQRSRGTTQISVADAEGNLASLTVSNGEGCGYVLPGTGVMLNNMLGEEDLNHGGFHRWPPGRRLSSMMAPTLALLEGDHAVVLGSGGSNRLRTAILQVLVRRLDFGASLEEAVRAPRLHFEGGALQIEPGFPEASVAPLLPLYPRHELWKAQSLYFGGVHAVEANLATGAFSGVADLRRNGAVALYPPAAS